MKTETFTLRAAIVADPDGGYSVIALNFPGCASCGQTEEEATVNIREAAGGLIESYRDADEPIPAREVLASDFPGAKVITVEVPL